MGLSEPEFDKIGRMPSLNGEAQLARRGGAGERARYFLVFQPRQKGHPSRVLFVLAHPNAASTSADNSVVFNGIVVPPAVIEPVPMLSPAMPALLALLLGGLAYAAQRRQRS